ncbi:MAG: AAA family ATPase [Planctomycetaceae bacterium]
MDLVCPACGTANPPMARFCMACGAALVPTRPADERRVVTILFVDLVGFTERSDNADPEDVRRTLVPYHAGVKAQLERFGGVLDKFIGDGVMGVFGSPIAHDDDPVRGVEAALAILELVDTLRRDDPGVAVRVAVNTGEAVVTFGSGPQVGESVAGDVVNTASRLQALAPRDGVVVGEATERAVRDRFELEELPLASVKGKAEPVRVWRVIGRASAPPAAEEPTAFVGRELELGALLEAYRDAVTTGSARLVVVVGEPGVGKSRLLRELERRLTREDPPPRWLASRCQPYGEDVAFRPAGRLVEAALGLDGTEDAATLHARLEEALRDTVASAPVRGGIARQLEALVRGTGAREEPASIQDLAAAAAALVSAGGPAVLAIEDVHWADPALLHLLRAGTTELRDRPCLLVATARPTGKPAFAEAIEVPLSPLGEADTLRLVDDLASRAGFAGTERRALAARSEGNPLFAVEFVRALAERAEAARSSMPLPDTLHSVIAARLDAVPAELRPVVLDAAVLGPELWPAALAALGDGDADAAAAALDGLAARGVVTAGAAGWFREGPTYRFTHALFREVAYARLPRAARAGKHLRAGEWLEEASGDRAVERADAIAFHYEQACLLAEASHDDEVAEAAREPAARWLNRAGRQARLLDALGAYERHERALRVAAPGSVERARALANGAAMGARAARLEGKEALARIEEALAIARERGEVELEGWTLVRQYSQMAFMGEGAAAEHVLEEAIALLETLPPGTWLAEAYAYRAEEMMLAGRTQDSLRWAERAIEVATTVGSDTVIMALHLRGNARCEAGDEAGLGDLREALRRAEGLGSAMDIVYSLMYLGEWAWLLETPAAGLVHIDAALDLSRRRGVTRQSFWAAGGSLAPLFDAGRWGELLERVQMLRGTEPELIDPTLFCVADIWCTKLAIARDDTSIAPSGEELLARARAIAEMHVVAPGLNAAALLAMRDGRFEVARAHLEELETVTASVSSPTYREEVVADATRAALVLGETGLAERFAAGEGTTARARCTYATAHAAVAEKRSDADARARWAEAAERWRAFGTAYEEALARDGVARCLAREGRDDDARVEREAAEALLAPLGAVRPVL